MSNSVTDLQNLLKKAEHYDADERFMALNDMTNQMKEMSGELDGKQQIPIRNCILSLLDDKSPDVTCVAVKALSTVAQRFSPEECVNIVNKLGELIVDPDKASNRDTLADGLKTIVGATRDQDGRDVATKLTNNLLRGLNADAKSNSEEITSPMVLLDVLKDVLQRFSKHMDTNAQSEAMKCLMTLLEHPNSELRKRANGTLGALVPCLPEEDFNVLIETVIQKIQSKKTPEQSLQTYIQTVGVISTAAAPRVGPVLPQIIPKLLEFCKFPENAHEAASDAVTERWENALHAFQNIIARCPQEVDKMVEELVNDRALPFMAYDPLVVDEEAAGGDEDDFGGDDFGGGDEWGGDDDGWGDDAGAGGAEAKGAAGGGWGVGGEQDVAQSDDDTSWRIRRAAVGILKAFVHARSDILKEHYDHLLTAVIKRFPEREPNVREEVLLCCRDLIHVAGVSEKEPHPSIDQALAVPKLIRLRSFQEPLTNAQKVNDLVKGCITAFKGAKATIKIAVYAVLRELVIVRSSSSPNEVLQPWLQDIFPIILQGIKNVDVSIKGDALRLLNVFLDLHHQSHVEDHVESLANAVTASIQSDPHPRTQADALRVVGAIARVLDPSNKKIVKQLFEVSFKELNIKDTDESVKETSIRSVSIIMSNFGGDLKIEQKEVMPVLHERLLNDVTRIPALEAFTRMAESPLGKAGKLDLSAVISTDAFTEICGFLRKNKSAVRQETAKTMGALIEAVPKSFKKDAFKGMMTETAAHIGDEDLQLAKLLLDALSSVIRNVEKGITYISGSDIPEKIHALSLSPMLQGQTLESLKEFYRIAVAGGGHGSLTYEKCSTGLLNAVNAQTSEPSLVAIAECIATMVTTLNAKDADETVKRFESEISETKSDDSNRALALYVLGEIGRDTDLGSHQKLDGILFKAFNNSAQSVKRAAAYAFGNVAVGNMDKYLPMLISKIQDSEDQRYLLLSSLKEIIYRHSQVLERAQSFHPRVQGIEELLFRYAESKNEGVREMVAECLGRCAQVDPTQVFPHLAERIKGKAGPQMKAVVITAVRFALAKGSELYVEEHLDSFLTLLKDEDLHVRRQAFLTVNALARAYVGIIVDSLEKVILPALYSETTQKPELVELKDFGAFKEKIDHGLPLRKAAFQTLQTILHVAPYKLKPFSAFMDQVKLGVQDENNDIQMMTYNVINYLADNRPADLLESLDDFSKPITAGIKPKLKLLGGKDKDAQTARDSCKSIVRTMFHILDVPGVDMKPGFTRFCKQIQQTKSLKESGILSEVRKERGEE